MEKIENILLMNLFADFNCFYLFHSLIKFVAEAFFARAVVACQLFTTREKVGTITCVVQEAHLQTAIAFE